MPNRLFEDRLRMPWARNRLAQWTLLLSLLFPMPGRAADAGYVGSQACTACHAAEANAWAASHHRRALQPPTPDNVLGDFADARFTHAGVTSRFFRDGDRYLVETDGPDGKLAVFEIAHAVGVEPLQQYLVRLDRGRLQPLDIAWDTERRRWFHLYPDEDVGAGSGLHWTGFHKNWQARCAVCHQTGFEKNYDAATRSYRSAWSEPTVGCEACHGPGAGHLAWANGEKTAGTAAHGWQPRRPVGRQERELDMCGPCHSRREALGSGSHPPLASFADHHALAPLDPPLYFPDGQQRDEVYVLGSFLQSRMHQRGVTCTDCHDAHSGRLVATGNAVCTQCHDETGRADFPTLKPRAFDSVSHHHHAEGSPAARCVTCHMPERTYMQVDGRRDHFFRVPDPRLSERAGSPDVCRSCHSGETAAWAAEAIRRWTPERRAPATAHGEEFVGVDHAASDLTQVARLSSLALDRSRPAITRATAIRMLADAGVAAPSLAPLVADASPLVREAAARLWRGLPPVERAARLKPLLGDPAASVRVAAALELAAVSPGDLPPGDRAPLAAAIGALRASLSAKSDFPEGQLAIAGLAMSSRDWAAAETALTEAVFMDPQLVDAWLSRGRIAAALGHGTRAAEILGTGLTANPGDLRIATDLAALLGSLGRERDVIPILREAATRHPQAQEPRIALAAALLRVGDLDAAEREIGILLSAAPNDAAALVLDAMHRYLSGDPAGAREIARKAIELYPGLDLPAPLRTLGVQRSVPAPP